MSLHNVWSCDYLESLERHEAPGDCRRIWLVLFSQHYCPESLCCGTADIPSFSRTAFYSCCWDLWQRLLPFKNHECQSKGVSENMAQGERAWLWSARSAPILLLVLLALKDTHLWRMGGWVGFLAVSGAAIEDHAAQFGHRIKGDPCRQQKCPSEPLCVAMRLFFCKCLIAAHSAKDGDK